MKDILAFASEVVDDTKAINDHADTDWTTLQETQSVTIKWAPKIAQSWADTLYNTKATQPNVAHLNRPDHEQSFAVWYERLVSGAPGRAFWAETCLIGLYHAASAVHNRHVVAMASKVEEMFLEHCLEHFEAARGLEVYRAFKRVFGLAISIMVDSYLHAIMLGMSQIGMNEKLVGNIRRVAIRKMIEEAREKLPLIDWTDALSVGIGSIDEQHKKLVALLNALHDSKVTGAGSQAMKDILNELTKYTVSHFSFEEKLMADHAYPERDTHMEAHKALVSQVAAFNEQFQAGNAKLSGDLFKFLRTWLNGHIRGTDKKYSAFMLERGVR